MFAIIKFNSDSSVAVVPSPWLKDLSTCWWPPHNVARNAVVRQIPPSENWALHEVKVLNMKGNVSIYFRSKVTFNYNRITNRSHYSYFDEI